jgi:hypothetical protein
MTMVEPLPGSETNMDSVLPLEWLEQGDLPERLIRLKLSKDSYAWPKCSSTLTLLSHM